MPRHVPARCRVGRPCPVRTATRDHTCPSPTWARGLFLLALPPRLRVAAARKIYGIIHRGLRGCEGLLPPDLLPGAPGVAFRCRARSRWWCCVIALAGLGIPLRGIESDSAPDAVRVCFCCWSWRCSFWRPDDLCGLAREAVRLANKWTSGSRIEGDWPEELADCPCCRRELACAMLFAPRRAPLPFSDERPTGPGHGPGGAEHRPYWRPGEGEFVLQMGRTSQEPAVRVAAIHALAGVSTPELVTGLSGFLRDQTPEVRLAAAEAPMWEADAPGHSPATASARCWPITGWPIRGRCSSAWESFPPPQSRT